MDVIHRCYNKILNREPDEDGLTTYKAYLKEHSENDLSCVLQKSNEYLNYIANKSFINIFMCVRNNANDIVVLFKQLEYIRRNDKIHEYRYYIYENDSNDHTVQLCQTFIQNNHGVVFSDTLNKKQWNDVKHIGRVVDMAIYRNKCKALCSDENMKNSEFCVLVDTKVLFDNDIFDRFSSVLQDKSIVMVTPYGKVGKRIVYYDTYALETLGSIVRINQGIIDVKSACGGIFMVRSDALRVSEWKLLDSHRSEHNNFCYEVGNFGRVVIDTDIHTEWTK